MEKSREAADWSNLDTAYKAVTYAIADGEIKQSNTYAMWYYRGNGRWAMSKISFTSNEARDRFAKQIESIKFKSKTLRSTSASESSPDKAIRIKIIDDVPYISVGGGGSGAPYKALDGTPFTLPVGNTIKW